MNMSLNYCPRSYLCYMKFQLVYSVFILFVLNFSCKTPMPELSSEAKLSKNKTISIRWTTTDPILAKVFPEVFPVPPAVLLEDQVNIADLSTVPMPPPDPNQSPKIQKQKPQNPNELPRWDRGFELTNIDNLTLVIRNESQRPFTSIGISLLALTMLYYGTMETEAELVWTSGETNLHRISFLRTKETIWAPMPFYIGTGSSIVAPILNSNRYPSHLQKYCIQEKPSKLRESTEQSYQKNCKEYETFLKRLLLQNYETIHLQLTEWEKRNQDWFQP
ncbi:Hypothetical lipoprotein [Leptospira biflexa serovar Patoc strain 'Patoc 1 (Ames)']|uniref:Uncharacterized protein n=2 Tax=Leptospira biflexa TaxID=172 RepID=B0SR88_LEPBP|nr:Hypothetical lipoprotein [Leptospira biflexa serovar Patoc strain 'Patoc 1 (Ames)']ABZ99380.1 Hypothetical protein LEPBI_I3315 [Leptospira biflexa serovar Patoc strain 'Patoc 1 (Paris)']